MPKRKIAVAKSYLSHLKHTPKHVTAYEQRSHTKKDKADLRKENITKLGTILGISISIHHIVHLMAVISSFSFLSNSLYKYFISQDIPLKPCSSQSSNHHPEQRKNKSHYVSTLPTYSEETWKVQPCSFTKNMPNILPNPYNQPQTDLQIIRGPEIDPISASDIPSKPLPQLNREVSTNILPRAQ